MSLLSLTLYVALASRARAALVAVRADQRGQATAEYALVLLGAAAIALMLTAWAAQTGAISALFDAVVERLIGKLG